MQSRLCSSVLHVQPTHPRRHGSDGIWEPDAARRASRGRGEALAEALRRADTPCRTWPTYPLQAEKELAKWSLFSSTEKNEKAADLYQRAGNAFKGARDCALRGLAWQWLGLSAGTACLCTVFGRLAIAGERAASAYEKAGDLQVSSLAFPCHAWRSTPCVDLPPLSESSGTSWTV